MRIGGKSLGNLWSSFKKLGISFVTGGKKSVVRKNFKTYAELYLIEEIMWEMLTFLKEEEELKLVFF